jgi:hypothetical protein
MNIGGAPEPLLTRTDDILSLCPSPDGRYLAFGPPLQSGNAWMLSNFPEVRYNRLRRVDHLIRELTEYRDFMSLKIKEQVEFLCDATF